MDCDLTVWAVLFTVMIVLFSAVILQYWTRFKPPAMPRQTRPKICLGQNFKLGMLYSAYSEKSLVEMLWSKEIVKKVTTTREKNMGPFFTIITENDFLSEKLLQQLDVDSTLGLYIASGLVETSRLSLEYLEDSRKLSRQARVVLHYKYNTKIKEMYHSDMMRRKAAPKVPQVTSADSPTHVIVGIEYGVEAFFVFDKNVHKSEDYDETCKQMESLIEQFPEFVKCHKKLSKQESLLANQLKVTLYSDIPFLEAYSFDHAIEICRKIAVLATLHDMVIPKKAWLYPLYHTETIVQNIQCSKEVLKLLRRLNVTDLYINDLMEQDVCKFFAGIHEQLNYIKVFVVEEKRQQLKEKLRQFLPQIRCKQCAETILETEIAPMQVYISSTKQWLKAKEKEIDEISKYHAKLIQLTDVKFLLSDEKFLSFMTSSEGVNAYIICLELEIDQKQAFDPEEICKRQVNKHKVMSIIEKFVTFVKEYHEAKCVVTVSHSTTVSQQCLGANTYLYEPGNFVPKKFEFPIPVKKPIIIGKSHDSVELKLTLPPLQMQNPTAYIVLFRTGKDTWQRKVFEGSQHSKVEIGELKASTEYEFKVAARYVYGLGPTSSESDSVVTNSLPLANRIIKDETLSKTENKILESNLSIVILKTKSVMRNDEKLIAKEEFGQPQPSKPTKVVILMGETGTGKSTLINGMVNYVLGVKCNDPFRFKLICDDEMKQTKSVTNIITAYTFYWQEGFAIPYNLIIIDTPGFGDTEGIERDKKIKAQVKDFFSVKGSNGIECIHAICVVVKFNSSRLTNTQKYVHQSILDIFSKGIEDNIFIMATFNDSRVLTAIPPVMEAIDAAKIPHKEWFSFQYSVTYEDPVQELTKFFWEMNYLSTENFFKNLHLTEASALELSRDVLKERERLESILNGMYPKMQEAMSKIDVFQKEEALLNRKELEMNAASQNYIYKVKVTKHEKVDLKIGTYVTNCLVCNFTCHYPCRISKDDEKYKCTAMNDGWKNNAKCNVCPKKCRWDQHFNNQYYFKTYTKEETRTSEDLLKRYKVAKNDKDAVERVIEGLHNDLADLSKSVYTDVREARKCIDRLNEIAFKPHNPMTEVEYIDLLLESEKQEQKPGFMDRIASYRKMKRKAQLLSKLTDEQIDEKFKQPDKTEWWQFWFD